MKILQINSVCGIRSTGRICADLADCLTTNGHECKIAYGREIVPERYREYAVRIGNDFDVKVHGLKTRLFDASGLGSKNATKTFLRWVDEYNPDIIHLHNIHGYYINIEMLFHYLVKAGKPVIWTLHDCWSFTGHCAYFSFAKCERWKVGCHNCPQRKEYPSSYILDRSRGNWKRKKAILSDVPVMLLVTPSNWLAELVRESFLNCYPVKVIQNGIDLDIFKPTNSTLRVKYGLEHTKIALGIASVWEHRKGLQYLLQLADELGNDWKVVVVGLSAEQIAALPANVLGIGRTDNVKELAQWYTEADVFINPSTEETMGMTIIEALACGTPAVVFDCTALPELITPATGMVVRPFDIKELKWAIKKCSLKKRPTSLLQDERYSKNSFVSSYYKLYEEITQLGGESPCIY